MPDDKVSLKELLEVRIDGLGASELFSILSSSCEFLAAVKNTKFGENLFSPDQMFLTRNGKVEIRLMSNSGVQKQFIPPELQQHDSNSIEPFEAQLIWCLGKSCLQALRSNHSDVTLFSLLNLMTVGHVQSRPTLAKVRQMIRNRLDVTELDKVPEVIAELHREVMGDLDELLRDPFNDDIRFSSSRSSHLSIVPGIGAPEHSATQNLSEYQHMLASEVADRLRRDFSLSRSHSQRDALEKKDGKEQNMEAKNPLENRYIVNIPHDFLGPSTIEADENVQKPIPSPRQILTPPLKEQKRNGKKGEDTEEEELTPRGPSPVLIKEEKQEKGGDKDFAAKFLKSVNLYELPKKTHEKIKEDVEPLGETNLLFSGEEENGKEREEAISNAQSKQKRHNLESIEVEVHQQNVNPSPFVHSSDHSDDLSQKPAGRLYAKATQTGKLGRILAKKESEIEVLSDEKERTREERDELDEKASFGDNRPPVVMSGYSPGTRRKVPLENNNNNKDSKGTIESAEAEEDKSKKLESVEEFTHKQQFRRQNSLQASKCSRISTSDRRKGVPSSKSTSFLPTVPEFLSNGPQPFIRLRAQSMKKKKMVSLHRSDPAVVFVQLLNGHTVEVNCRTDALVGSIFHTVAEHLNITEHLFFGLALNQQNENIFLEQEQRLEKWAPPGWKGPGGLRRSFGAGGTLSRQREPVSEQYTLYLRFRYYPKKREFVKNSTTAHQLYLQLRQDMLSGVLRFSPRERAFEMAALALSAESTALPAEEQKEYFKLENYLPAKYYEVEPSEALQVQRRIADLHRRLAASFGYLEAEEQFISRCQMEALYGSHFYRVYKIKPRRDQPAHHSRPLYSDFRLVAVMPSGITICREENNSAGTKRLINSAHEWHMIRTLQFDRKRFLLGTIEDNIAVDHVFYTDHHSKASYLVRFAASQHRFMLKMRQWQGTLNQMRVVQRQKDVGVEKQHPQRRASNGGIAGSEMSPYFHSADNEQQIQQQIHAKPISHPQMGIGQKIGPLSSTDRSSNDKPGSLAFETENEYIQYCYGSEAKRIDAVLEKDPDHGLGLTLVDGAVNGVKGVYVKSVSLEGDGKRKGLLIGDCLLSVNGISLFNKSRHDAVELVRDCGREVTLELLRFPSISEVFAQDTAATLMSVATKHSADSRGGEEAVDRANKSWEGGRVGVGHSESRTGHRRSSDLLFQQQIEDQVTTSKELRKESTATIESKTSSGSATSKAKHRQRAVSDFGATYLPTLRTEDILMASKNTPNRTNNNKPQRYRRHKTSAGFPEQRNSDSSSEESSENETIGKSDGGGMWRGEYKPQLPPVLAMYSHDDDDIEEEGEDKTSMKQPQNTPNHRLINRSPQIDTFSLRSAGTQQNTQITPNKSSPFASAVERFARLDNSAESTSWNSAKRSAGKESGKQRENNLDWANCLSDVDSDSSSSPVDPTNRKHHRFTIHIPRDPIEQTGGYAQLPFQIEFIPGKGVLVGAIDVGKLPSSVHLCIGDRIMAVNGISVSGCTQQQMVEMMREKRSMCGGIELIVERKLKSDVDEGARVEGDRQQQGELSVTVILDKTQNGAIGLSLAKRMGFEGVFVRNIAPDSIAARESTLRVGDRMWRIQGEEVGASESPANVVKRLKELPAGQFTIEIRRKRE